MKANIYTVAPNRFGDTMTYITTANKIYMGKIGKDENGYSTAKTLEIKSDKAAQEINEKHQTDKKIVVRSKFEDGYVFRVGTWDAENKIICVEWSTWKKQSYL